MITLLRLLHALLLALGRWQFELELRVDAARFRHDPHYRQVCLIDRHTQERHAEQVRALIARMAQESEK
jgi:hypothetical protein